MADDWLVRRGDEKPAETLVAAHAGEQAVRVALPAVPVDVAGAPVVAGADAEDTLDEAVAGVKSGVVLLVALRPAKRGQASMHEAGTVTDEGSREGAGLDPWLFPLTVSALGIRPTLHCHYHCPIPYVCACFFSQLAPSFWLPWRGVLAPLEVPACSCLIAHCSFAWKPVYS